MEVFSNKLSEEHKIELLPEEVSNQIAAGEVVERPSSVVKELVENSIDSGASEIIVEINNGGKNLKIIDNGKGIPPEQVQLAFKRFATSKIRQESDLWNLYTMGFRGEALASIASISKVEMRTKRKQDSQGTKIEVHGNVVIGIEPVGCSYGTSITIDDLFYNTPARLKFLKSDTTETSHILDLMHSFAIAYPDVSFTVFSKNREAFRTSGGSSSMQDAVRVLYGKEMSDSLIEVDYETKYGKVKGLVSKQTYSRSDKNKQVFFVNGRWVKIPFVTKLLDDIYTDLIPSHKYPVAFLKLDLSPAEIDINVHPTKKEVRFHSNSEIYEIIYRGVMNALYPPINERLDSLNSVNEYSSEYENSNLPNTNSNYEPEINNNYTNNFRSYDTPRSSSGSSNYSYSHNTNQMNNRSFSSPSGSTIQQSSFYEELRINKTLDDTPKDDLSSIKPIGRIYETYILGYLGNDLCFIDQHLAHERYLYEQLEFSGHNKQDLLTPIMLNLSEVEWEYYINNKEIFEEYGYIIEEFGNRTVIIRSIPCIFELVEAENVFKGVLQELIEDESKKKVLDKLTHTRKTMACKAARRAGDYLDMEDMKALIKNWATTKQPYNCPHGRPVIYKMPRHDIDKQFNRTW